MRNWVTHSLNINIDYYFFALSLWQNQNQFSWAKKEQKRSYETMWQSFECCIMRGCTLCCFKNDNFASSLWPLNFFSFYCPYRNKHIYIHFFILCFKSKKKPIDSSINNKDFLCNCEFWLIQYNCTYISVFFSI